MVWRALGSLATCSVVPGPLEVSQSPRGMHYLRLQVHAGLFDTEPAPLASALHGSDCFILPLFLGRFWPCQVPLDPSLPQAQLLEHLSIRAMRELGHLPEPEEAEAQVQVAV